ncbi:hypothetical protein JQ615_33880 [Bradyrhizobium jicamae]|uniref:Uncharacterized protein n=1 Tax=Bradyrhizobium jicamae TaxID=280332 RepID=A0ABS5FVS2_9BRAD|nr:hypothetical protein [Bradyrhizobium jicamae]MBR0800371.1 hypothetical protein [Bradyrhizobium jicamae]MBR0937839.1 hypothetical protein [Bradyrhizobium jicamae]
MAPYLRAIDKPAMHAQSSRWDHHFNLAPMPAGYETRQASLEAREDTPG